MIKPKVEIINYTQNALDILVFTKSARLKPKSSFNDIVNMSMQEKLEHLEYMMDAIKTSFEFVDYIRENE